jgi:hypothetical protein
MRRNRWYSWCCPPQRRPHRTEVSSGLKRPQLEPNPRLLPGNRRRPRSRVNPPPRVRRCRSTGPLKPSAQRRNKRSSQLMLTTGRWTAMPRVRISTAVLAPTKTRSPISVGTTHGFIASKSSRTEDPSYGSMIAASSPSSAWPSFPFPSAASEKYRSAAICSITCATRTTSAAIQGQGHLKARGVPPLSRFMSRGACRLVVAIPNAFFVQ